MDENVQTSPGNFAYQKIYNTIILVLHRMQKVRPSFYATLTVSSSAVSDACVIGVFRSLSQLLTSLLTMKSNHERLPQAVSYFETMCALLNNFTVHYIDKGKCCEK